MEEEKWSKYFDLSNEDLEIKKIKKQEKRAPSTSSAPLDNCVRSVHLHFIPRQLTCHYRRLTLSFRNIMNEIRH